MTKTKNRIPPLEDGMTYFINEHGNKVVTGTKMGLRNCIPDDLELPCTIELTIIRLKWVDGDYLSSGVYFGNGTRGENIYRGVSVEHGIDMYVRASSWYQSEVMMTDTITDVNQEYKVNIWARKQER